MTIEQLGAIGELVSSIAVVASLLFVGFQIRQNTRTERAAAVQGAADFFSTLLIDVAKHPELRRVWPLVSEPPESMEAPPTWADLDADQRTISELLIYTFMNSCDRVYVQMEQGVAMRWYWDEVRAWMVHHFLQSPLVRDWWRRVPIPAGMYREGFRNEISRDIDAVEATAGRASGGD